MTPTSAHCKVAQVAKRSKSPMQCLSASPICCRPLLAWKLKCARWHTYRHCHCQHIGAAPNFNFQAVTTSHTAVSSSNPPASTLRWDGAGSISSPNFALAFLPGPGSTMLPCETSALVSCGFLSWICSVLCRLAGAAAVSRLDAWRSSRRCD